MATTNRPSAAMTSAARSTRFGDFTTAPGRHNSDERSSQTSTLGQTFGNGASWQASSGIWGSGFGNTKRDASRPRADKESRSEGPSGSSALTASSEADPWGSRNSGPWNQPDTTSPTMHSHSGSASPTRVRTSMPNSSQQLLELQNSYHNSRQAIGQGKSFSRPQPKSNLDPSSGSFNFVRKPSFGFHEDKENYTQESVYDGDLSARNFRLDQITSQNGNYLGVNGASARDTSMPPSRASDYGLNGSSSYSNGNPSFGSFGHTPASSIHSQRPSFSGASGSFSQPNGSRYAEVPTQSQELELREKVSGVGYNMEIAKISQNGGYESPYSPNQLSFAQNHQQSGPMWNEASKSFNPYAPEYNPPGADPAYFARTQRFNDRGSVSPAGSDYRRSLGSPKYYSTTSTPGGQTYRPASQGARMPQGTEELNQRLQAIQLVQQQQAYLYAGGFPGQYPTPYDYLQNFRPAGMPYGYPMPMPVPPFPSAPAIPSRPAKDQDVGAGVRSPLLEEFRGNTKGSKKFELKDIFNHIVEFSGDQHGSRFIQQKLETANSDDKEQLFREIQPNALQLMTDVFGNYVIQKMFEHGSQVQKRILAEQMKNHVHELSLQMYGCRVVQKALEHVLADQQAELVKELKHDIMKCIKDANGNHVVQKAVERLPVDQIRFIIDAFRGLVHLLAVHPYGCRVIQRILEYCPAEEQTSILDEFHECASMLFTDQYGNYVSQHVIAQGKPEDRSKVIKVVIAQVLPLSKHKYASNVVEKSIQFGTEEERKAIVSQITAVHSDGTSPLQLMIKDQFGNYVIQKLLLQLTGAERETLVEDLKPHLVSQKKFNYGKQIAAIEKLIFTGQPTYNTTPSPMSSQIEKDTTIVQTALSQASETSAQTQPIEIGTTTPIPSLTMGQNSPQSSSLPSTSASTVDGPVDDLAKSNKAIINECSEVVINGI